MRFPETSTHLLAAAALVALAGCTPDDVRSPEPAAHAHATADGLTCDEISVHCGRTPSLTFDRSGRLWAVFEKDGHAYMTRSDDQGASFSPPVRVNAEAEEIETNGEGRPKLALGPRGEIYVSWTKKTGRFAGDIRFSRSLDGGTHFEPPITINDDSVDAGQRFDALQVDEAGDVYLAWIDKRDREAAAAGGEEYRGVALYYTVSTDRGAGFSTNRRVAHHSCECCRIGVAAAPGGGAAILWRHVFAPNVRDHAFTLLGREEAGPLRRASHEGWAIDACPHHGPALVPAAGVGYHTTWFTAAEGRPRIYYGRFDAESGTTRHLREIASGARASHPHIARAGGRVVAVWKEMDRGRSTVYGIASTDGGETWSAPRPLASTEGASDHPLLLAHDEIYLAWHTGREGLRIVPVPEES